MIYKHLSLEERYYIEFSMKGEKASSAIGKELGQNENANSLLRQYLPKSMELINVTIRQVFGAVHRLSCRLRKCLGFKTSHEAFEELTSVNDKH